MVKVCVVTGCKPQTPHVNSGVSSPSGLVLTQGNSMLLICVFYEVQDTTKVLLQYYILFIYKSSNVHMSPYYQDTWPSLAVGQGRRWHVG